MVTAVRHHDWHIGGWSVGIAHGARHHGKAVADFHAGKETAIKFLVGQVMRETRGRANAGVVTGLLEKELNV